MQATLSSPVKKNQIYSALSSQAQELILLPTEQCNFRCTYCYEDFEVGTMPRAVRNGVKNLIAARIKEIKHLSFMWFGGEPLIALNVVRDIARYAYDLCQEHGVTFGGGFTTNGYVLTPKLMEELVGLNQREYQISLDGDQAVHDTTRRRIDGKGTFERIWGNLVDLHHTDLDFQITLRLHVTHNNFESLKDLCARIHQNFGQDKRYLPHFHDVRDLGGQGSSTVQQVLIDTYSQQVDALTQILVYGAEGKPSSAKPTAMHISAAYPQGSESASTTLYQQPSDTPPAETIHDQPYICYAAKANSLLIRADGRVGKCTVALSDSRNDIGTLQEDGTIRIDQARLLPWIRGLQTLDVDELACPYQLMPHEAAFAV